MLKFLETYLTLKLAISRSNFFCYFGLKVGIPTFFDALNTKKIVLRIAKIIFKANLRPKIEIIVSSYQQVSTWLFLSCGEFLTIIINIFFYTIISIETIYQILIFDKMAENKAWNFFDVQIFSSL